MSLLLDISQAYFSIIQDEKQQNLGTRRKTTEAFAMVVQKEEPKALVVHHKSSLSFRPNSNYRKSLYCSHSDKDHRTRVTCWKLHGYPPGQSKHATVKNHHFKPNNDNQSSTNHARMPSTTHV